MYRLCFIKPFGVARSSIRIARVGPMEILEIKKQLNEEMD
jgi:hypothetical protein